MGKGLLVFFIIFIIAAALLAAGWFFFNEELNVVLWQIKEYFIELIEWVKSECS